MAIYSNSSDSIFVAKSHAWVGVFAGCSTIGQRGEAEGFFPEVRSN
jgi:hypothetical protein